MRRQLRLWIVGVSNACDPRFYSKGVAKPDFMFRVGTCVRCDGLAVSLDLDFAAQRELWIAT